MGGWGEDRSISSTPFSFFPLPSTRGSTDNSPIETVSSASAMVGGGGVFEAPPMVGVACVGSWGTGKDISAGGLVGVKVGILLRLKDLESKC